MIVLDNVTVTYQNKRKKAEPTIGLSSFSATFEDNSFNVIIGPSGGGKTTLLKAIAGLVEYDGDIYFDGVKDEDLTISQRNFSAVTQNYDLYPHMTVFDNIAYVLKIIGTPREEIIKRVHGVADEVGIGLLLTRRPKQLSGGQQQRVALAKALIKNPSFYLFDEPLSNVDPAVRREERLLIKKILKNHRATAIYVTHDIKEAYSLADRIYVINEGKLEASGTPMEILKSTNKIVEELNRSSYEI